MILGSQFINNLTVNHNALISSKLTYGFRAAVLFWGYFNCSKIKTQRDPAIHSVADFST